MRGQDNQHFLLEVRPDQQGGLSQVEQSDPRWSNFRGFKRSGTLQNGFDSIGADGRKQTGQQQQL